MIYDNIDFHNVEALTQVDGQAGLRIQRVPEEVREKMSENGQEMLLSPIANVELRFVVESDDIEIRLSKVGDESLKMFVFFGGEIFRKRIFMKSLVMFNHSNCPSMKD